jgi:hypothetical protein
MPFVHQNVKVKMIAEKIGRQDFLRRQVERAMQQVLQTEMTGFLAEAKIDHVAPRERRDVAE